MKNNRINIYLGHVVVYAIAIMFPIVAVITKKYSISIAIFPSLLILSLMLLKKKKNLSLISLFLWGLIITFVLIGILMIIAFLAKSNELFKIIFTYPLGDEMLNP